MNTSAPPILVFLSAGLKRWGQKLHGTSQSKYKDALSKYNREDEHDACSQIKANNDVAIKAAR